MRKSRTNTLLLTAVFTVVGLIGQAWLARKSAPATWAHLNPEVASPIMAPFGRTPLVSTKPPCVPAVTLAPATRSPAMFPLQLSDDATALVAEMCELQLMAHGTDLTLDSRQWAAFATVVLRVQAIRQSYEVLIANLKVLAPGQYRLEIPVYANAGDELRAQFSTELRAELGEPTALEVMAKLGDRLEGRFAGFGAGVQTLDITANPAEGPGDVLVTRAVKYWDSVAGSDRLRTRREVHLPAWEDPTGDSWSSLWAKIAETADAGNGSGQG